MHGPSKEHDPAGHCSEASPAPDDPAAAATAAAGGYARYGRDDAPRHVELWCEYLVAEGSDPWLCSGLAQFIDHQTYIIRGSGGGSVAVRHCKSAV